MIRGLVAGQAALGHRVELISSDPLGCSNVQGFFEERMPMPTRTVVRPKFFRAIYHRRRLLRALRGVDVAHLHGIWPVATLLASQICRELGIPYILAPHGSLHSGALWERPGRKILGMWVLGFGPMIRNAAAIHALNEDEHAGAAWVPLPKRVEVIPNGIFESEFAELPPLGAFRRTVPGLGEAPFILFLSRMHRGKGCDLLGEAFAEVARAVPEAHLVVIGRDQGGRAMIEGATPGLERRIHFLGHVTGARKYHALRDAAVFCLPSRHEGFSMAITEAMASARPVVITQECHFPLVGERDAGRVVPLDSKALARGLIEVLQDPAAADEMGARGRALIYERFTWPVIAKQTLKLYESVL